MVLTSSYDADWPLITENGQQILSEILSPLGENPKTFLINGTTIQLTNCKSDTLEFWNMILPIGIILFVSLTIMLIAWKYQYNRWIKEGKLQSFQYRKAQLQFIDQQKDDEVIYNRGRVNPIFIETPNLEKRFVDNRQHNIHHFKSINENSDSSESDSDNNMRDFEDQTNKLGESSNSFIFSHKVLR